MPPRLAPVALAAMTLVCSTPLSAASDTDMAGSPPSPASFPRIDRTDVPSFRPTTGCEKLEDYDPQWAGHGDDYGLKPLAAGSDGKASDDEEAAYVSGFYQIREHDGTLYAAFGGRLTRGVTPGALVALDADTLAFRKAIKLPFAAHSVAIDQNGSRAVVTHTHVNAFSLVDLASGQSRCRKADTALHGQPYQGRYVTLDEDGSFYINYNVFAPGKPTSHVMKYTPEGDHAPGFAVQPTGSGLVIPLAYIRGQLLTGNHGVMAVDTTTGAVSPLTSTDESANVYNYVAGPGHQLLASSYNIGAHPNLLLIDPDTGSRSGILTGSGTVEVAYSPESGQAFSTNYDSKTVTVAALSRQAGAFTPGQFMNIAFEDEPSNLHVRHTDQGTDVYLSTKNWDDDNAPRGARLHRIHIDATVRGIEGLGRPGACTITTFDMANRQVSAPVPCKLMDASATWQTEHRRATEELADQQMSLREAVEDRKKALADLKKARTRSRHHADKAARKALREARESLEEAQMTLDDLNRKLPDARTALQVFRRLAGQ